nr:hypothetical protein CFP56_13857 [Quercus suber]
MATLMEPHLLHCESSLLKLMFTTLVDTLAAIDQSLNDFEIVSFLLAGLGSDYDSIVTSVTTRVDPLSIEDLFGHLLAHEIRLEQQQPTVDLALARANFAGRQNSLSQSGRGSSSSTQKYNRGRGRGRG